MSALEPNQTRAMRDAASPQVVAARVLVDSWVALHARGNRIAAMAALSAEAVPDSQANLFERLARMNGDELETMRQGLEDIEAMLACGIRALETIAQRGATITAPALALWREYHFARSSIERLIK